MPNTWTKTYINDLPDTAFLFVGSGGKKDKDGRTAPRKLRQFAVRDTEGKLNHTRLRSALVTAKGSKDLGAAAKARIIGAAAGLITASNKVGSKAGKPKTVVSTGLSTVPKDYTKLLISDDQVQGRAFNAVSSVTRINGDIPVQRIQKTIMRTGRYKHPSEGWEFDVTPERLEHFVKAFAKMRENGVDCGFVKDHSFTADNSLGFVVDMWVDGDELVAVHEARGHDAIALSQKLPRTSPWVDIDFHDGKGNGYGEAIVHNSISQAPVIPGMHDDFLPIEDGKERAVAMAFSAGIRMSGADDDDPMKAIAARLGVDEVKEADLPGIVSDLLDGLDTDGSFDAILAAVETLDDDSDDDEGDSDDDDSDNDDSDTDESAGKGTGKPATSDLIDADTAELVAQSVETIAASCVETGRITPKVRKELDALLIGKEGKRNAVALSMRHGSGKVPLAMAVYRALAKNELVEMKEKTGQQVVAMARSSGDPETDIASVTEQMLEEQKSSAKVVL